MLTSANRREYTYKHLFYEHILAGSSMFSFYLCLYDFSLIPIANHVLLPSFIGTPIRTASPSASNPSANLSPLPSSPSSSYVGGAEPPLFNSSQQLRESIYHPNPSSLTTSDSSQLRLRLAVFKRRHLARPLRTHTPHNFSPSADKWLVISCLLALSLS